MSYSPDINLVDMILDHENLFNFSKDGHKTKTPDEENLDWISDDFLNSILKSNIDENLPLFEENGLLQNDLTGGVLPVEFGSDSGVCSEHSLSPSRSEDVTEDLKFEMDEFLSHPSMDATGSVTNEHVEVQYDSEQYVKEEVIECEVDQSDLSDGIVTLVDSDSNIDTGSEMYVLSDSDPQTDSAQANNCEVQYLNVNANNKSILLPLSSLKGFKVIQANRQQKVLKYLTSTKNLTSRRKSSDVTSDDGSDDPDFLYPRLRLTPEEEKLAKKEGIKLPTHYPLTKFEERELKRIRRKIRNKISAQDSRRRRKEYVDGLEERVKRCAEENETLMKRIRVLQTRNTTLTTQMRKLQSLLTRGVGQSAQPSTCLLVLIMSLALVLAPTLKNSPASGDAEDEGISMADDGTSVIGGGRSRNLLFSQKGVHDGQCNLDEETKTLTEQLEKLQIPNLNPNIIGSLIEVFKNNNLGDNLLLKDHDYFRPRKRAATDEKHDSWPPPKIPSIRTNNRGLYARRVADKLDECNGTDQEPIVIDLLDE